jgi:uncharacterized protein (DUF952 family)
MHANDGWLYHIAERSAWEAPDVADAEPGAYAPEAYADEGFIHLSYANQVVGTAGRYYQERSDIVLLRIDPGQLNSQVIDENLLGGKVLFPHLYGTLPRSAVIAIGAVHWSGAGKATFQFD